MEAAIDFNGNHAILEDALLQAKDMGLLEYALKYAIDNNMKLNEDELGTTNPLKYAADHGIQIDGVSPSQYAIRELENELIKDQTGQNKTIIEERLKDLQEVFGYKDTAGQIQNLAKEVLDNKVVRAMLNNEELVTLSRLNDTQNLPLIKEGLEKLEQSLNQRSSEIDELAAHVEAQAQKSRMQNVKAIFGKCSKAIGALLSGKIDIAKNHLEGAKESMSMLTAKKSEKEKLVGSVKSKKEEVKGKKSWVSFLKEKAGTLQSQAIAQEK